MDKHVFEAKVSIFNYTATEKSINPDLVDVRVDAEMGRIQIVFLMKFVSDFLTFLEPFSDAKEIVAEKANLAIAGAREEAAKAYSNSTRVQLDVKAYAPLIIIPIHSKSRRTFMADLGKLRLKNQFSIEPKTGKVFDHMHFSLKNLTLHRSKIAESVDSNEVLRRCKIIGGSDGENLGGISFELFMDRSMTPSSAKTDPAELSVKGILNKIQISLTKGDYNVMISLLQENFSEKGQFMKERDSLAKGNAQRLDRSSMQLPIKKQYGTSRASSRASVSSDGAKSLKGTQQKDALHKDPETKYVKFDFTFHGLEMEIFTGETPLDVESLLLNSVVDVERDPESSLAKIAIQLLSVNGELLVNGNLKAIACLQDLQLEDSRSHISKSSSSSSGVANEVQLREEDRIVT